jgi:CheY-like chemotaxis protein
MNSVLVIDDSPPMRQALRAVLTLKGYQTRTAGDGPAGLAAVEQNPPDVILLDMMMPGMSGLDFLRALRQTPRGAPLPVIVVSASDAQAEEARTLGATDYLVKSRYSNADLLARVARHMPVKSAA